MRSLEIFPDLAEQARANVLAAAVNNVAVEAADGDADSTSSWPTTPSPSPARCPLYDERFQRALKIGGRLFVVVGQTPVMEAWKVTRIGEREWQRESLFETVVDPLV